LTAAPQPPPALTELKLTDAMKEAVNSSYMSGKPMVVAYVDENGQPSLSYRGSAQAYSDTALAVWVRNPDGGLAKALPKNARVTLLYRDPGPENRAMLVFRGVGRIDESEAARRQVYDSSPEPERNADREEKGKALIVELERVDGFMPGARVMMRK